MGGAPSHKKFRRALERGDEDTALELLDRKNLDVSHVFKNHDDITPLHLAVNFRCTRCLTRFIADGADPNLANTSHGLTALHLACINENVAYVNALLAIDGIDVNLATDVGYTAAHMCAARSFVPGLVALVSHRDIDLDLQDVQGNTVAHVAALVANEETVAALLDNTEPGSFDLEATNHDQRTPLECAAALGHWAVVRRFADHGGRLVPTESRYGRAVTEPDAQENLRRVLATLGVGEALTDDDSYSDSDSELPEPVFAMAHMDPELDGSAGGSSDSELGWHGDGHLFGLDASGTPRAMGVPVNLHAQTHFAVTKAGITAQREAKVDYVAIGVGAPKPIAAALLAAFKWNESKTMEAYFADPLQACEKAGVSLPRSAVFGVEDYALNGDGGEGTSDSAAPSTSTPAETSTEASETGSGGDAVIPDARWADGPADPVTHGSFRPSGSGRSLPGTDLMCLVCMEQLPIEDVFDLECGHAFCSTCFAGHLNVKINDGEVQNMTCPGYDCEVQLDDSLIRHLVTDDVYGKYQTFLTNVYIQQDEHVKWCPAPGCELAMSSSNNRTRDVICPCGFVWCWSCQEEGHAPLSCSAYRRWNEDYNLTDDPDSASVFEWLANNTSPCPGCGEPIEKNGGCNLVRCNAGGAGCGMSFCWVCLTDWSHHNSHFTCNRPQLQGDAERLRAERRERLLEEGRAAGLDDTARFYLVRFKNHDLGGEREAELLADISRKMSILQESTPEVLETEILHRAVTTLIRCRQTLKWSYAFAFFLQDGFHKRMFEYRQELFEKDVENLAQILEETSFSDDANLHTLRFSYQIYACRNRLSRLVRGALINQKKVQNFSTNAALVARLAQHYV